MLSVADKVTFEVYRVDFCGADFSAGCTTLSLPSMAPISRPRILAISGYTFTFSNGGSSAPVRISGPAAKKMAFIVGMIAGQNEAAGAAAATVVAGE